MNSVEAPQCHHGSDSNRDDDHRKDNRDAKEDAFETVQLVAGGRGHDWILGFRVGEMTLFGSERNH